MKFECLHIRVAKCCCRIYSNGGPDVEKLEAKTSISLL